MDVAVQKYGGTSLATVEMMHTVAGRVARRYRGGTAVVVVVSARGRSTDELLALAARVSATRPARELDQLLATGECASAALLALALHDLGVPAVSLTGGQAGIRAAGKPGEAQITEVHTGRIRQLLGAGSVVVVAGFQGVDAAGDIVTLGRGGSDTTAVALAAALAADSCEIYTDVEGVCTADPRVVPGASVLSTVDTEVMAELAGAGARVLEPRSVLLAAAHGVPVRVRSAAGTAAGTALAGAAGPPGPPVAVAHDPDTALVVVHPLGARRRAVAPLLAVLAEQDVPVDLLGFAGYGACAPVGFTVRPTDLGGLLPALRGALAGRARVRADAAMGTVSLVGPGLLARPGYTARALGALSAAGVPARWVCATRLRTSVVTARARVLDAVRAVHGEFAAEWEQRCAPCR
jgi:aspartate kinase